MSKKTRYQLRRYAVRPGMQAEAERRLADHTEPDGLLLGSWTTDVGPLNRIVQLWSALDANAACPAGPIDDLLEEPCSVATLTPFPFSPAVPTSAIGPHFELRIYTFRPSELERLATLWERALPERIAMSPLAGIWHTSDSDRCQLIHLWPYRSLDERIRIRAAAIASRRWPPSVVARNSAETYRVEAQESWMLVPSAFSPLR